MSGSKSSFRNRTLPSSMTAWQPPGWKAKGSSLAPQFCVVQGHPVSPTGYSPLVFPPEFTRVAAGAAADGVSILVDHFADVVAIGVEKASGIGRAGDSAGAGVGIGPPPDGPQAARGGGDSAAGRVGDVAVAQRAGEGVEKGGQGVVRRARQRGARCGRRLR